MDFLWQSEQIFQITIEPLAFSFILLQLMVTT